MKHTRLKLVLACLADCLRLQVIDLTYIEVVIPSDVTILKHKYSSCRAVAEAYFRMHGQARFWKILDDSERFQLHC